MDTSEESQDFDITILPENDQPRHSSDGSDMLPNFQFLDGRGPLQDSSDRTIEGFVALKMTYEHVFRKQREETRLLQQKNQRLADEIQLLKKEFKCSKHCTTVDQSVSCLEGLTQRYCDQEPAAYQKNSCIPNEASPSVNTISASIASLENLVLYYRRMNLMKCPRSESGMHRNCNLDREQPEDEDRPEGTLREDNFSLYNLKRLCMKLKKLQEIPAKYQCMMEHICTSLGSSSFDDTISTSTYTSPQSEGSSSCLVGIHSIKLPPTDFSKQALQRRDDSTCESTMYYQESLVASNNVLVCPRQDGKYNYHSQRMPACDTEPVGLGFPYGDFSFEQACDPPTHVGNKESSFLSVNSVTEEKCGEKGKDSEEDSSEEQQYVVTSQVVGSENSDLVPKKLTKIKNSRSTELTMQNTQNTYVPGSYGLHDEELVTAQSSVHCVGKSVPLVECPVCSKTFPADTLDEIVASHVNLHFDDQLDNKHSFEILYE